VHTEVPNLQALHMQYPVYAFTFTETSNQISMY